MAKEEELSFDQKKLIRINSLEPLAKQLNYCPTHEELERFSHQEMEEYFLDRIEHTCMQSLTFVFSNEFRTPVAGFYYKEPESMVEMDRNERGDRPIQIKQLVFGIRKYTYGGVYYPVNIDVIGDGGEVLERVGTMESLEDEMGEDDLQKAKDVEAGNKLKKGSMLPTVTAANTNFPNRFIKINFQDGERIVAVKVDRNGNIPIRLQFMIVNIPSDSD